MIVFKVKVKIGIWFMVACWSRSGVGEYIMPMCQHECVCACVCYILSLI